MDEQKYINIAKQLIEKSDLRTYTVISNSMSPFVRINDKVICRKTDITDIKKYSIVAFYNTNNQKVPLVHRAVKIIRKDKQIFLKTKGDNAVAYDKELINNSQIIGEVCEITRNGRRISVDTGYGRFISILWYIVSVPVTFFKYVGFKIRNMFAGESQCLPDDNFIVLRQSVASELKDWLNTVGINRKILEKYVKKGTGICDISFGGGYSEESFNFIRKGYEIDYIKYGSTGNNRQYDTVICSRVINIADSYEKRHQIYSFIKDRMSENGKALISYINYRNGMFLKLKRMIFGLSSKYAGPAPDDIICKNIFTAKHLPYKTFVSELKNAGLKISESVNRSKTVTVVCIKDI